MITRTVTLINSFARRTLAHKTMSPRRIMYGRGFKTPLCKFGELVMAYEPKSSNDTLRQKKYFLRVKLVIRATTRAPYIFVLELFPKYYL